MKLSEFEKVISDKYKFEKYWSWSISVIFFLLGLWFSLYFKFGQFPSPSNDRFGIVMGFILMVFGVSGMLVLKTKYRVSVVRNNESKERNLQRVHGLCRILSKGDFTIYGSYATVFYQKSWWSATYIIYLFADNNVLAVNVQSGQGINGGFIDFGASKRLERNILNMLL